MADMPTPIHQWLLNEATGETIIYDYGSSEPSAAYGVWSNPSNGVISVQAPNDSGLYFNGSNYITSSHNDNNYFQTDYPVSLSAWVRTEEPLGTGSERTTIGGPMYSAMDGRGNGFLVELLLIDAAYPTYSVRPGSGSAREVTDTGSILNDGRWHNIAGVSSASNSHTLYVDGEYKGNNAGDVPWSYSLDSWSIGVRSAKDFLLPQVFTGEINDFRVYDVALTAAQVKNIWDVGVRSWSDQVAPILLSKNNMTGGMQE